MPRIPKKYHYLYKTTNLINNKYYYGMHSTNDLNDEYLGSGIYLNRAIKKYGKNNFVKEIIEHFNSREELSNAEEKLITSSIVKDKYCMNCMMGGEGWNTIGMVTVKNKDGLTFKVFIDDERYLNGELVSVSKGQVTVKDKNGNAFNVSINDERYLSGELISYTTGKINVKDKAGNKFQVDKTDERYLNGELVGVIKGQIIVKDKAGNKFQVDKTDKRYLSGELKCLWQDKKHSDVTKQKLREKAQLRTGDKNSSFGTCWITKNKVNKKIKLIDLDTYLNLGWIKGRK